MTVAILGAGNAGRALASSAARAGHTVWLASRDPERARSAASEIGVQAAASNREAVEHASVVILAVPTDSRDAAVAELADSFRGKVVVDITNRPTPDPSGATGPQSLAEELQALLPSASVVKAFNTALAARQADPVLAGIPLDGYVAADDEEAKKVVLDLVASMGFTPVDAGPLMNARILEGMAWLNIFRNMQGGTWQDGWKLLAP